MKSKNNKKFRTKRNKKSIQGNKKSIQGNKKSIKRNITKKNNKRNKKSIKRNITKKNNKRNRNNKGRKRRTTKKNVRVMRGGGGWDWGLKLPEKEGYLVVPQVSRDDVFGIFNRYRIIYQYKWNFLKKNKIIIIFIEPENWKKAAQPSNAFFKFAINTQNTRDIKKKPGSRTEHEIKPISINFNNGEIKINIEEPKQMELRHSLSGLPNGFPFITIDEKYYEKLVLNLLLKLLSEAKKTEQGVYEEATAAQLQEAAAQLAAAAKVDAAAAKVDATAAGTAAEVAAARVTNAEAVAVAEAAAAGGGAGGAEERATNAQVAAVASEVAAAEAAAEEAAAAELAAAEAGALARQLGDLENAANKRKEKEEKEQVARIKEREQAKSFWRRGD